MRQAGCDSHAPLNFVNQKLAAQGSIEQGFSCLGLGTESALELRSAGQKCQGVTCEAAVVVPERVIEALELLLSAASADVAPIRGIAHQMTGPLGSGDGA